MTLSSDELKKLVREAEDAVAPVKDPELKRAAFEKILERLLADGGPPRAKAKGTGREALAASSPARKAKEGPKARVEELIAQGFFKKPRTLSDVKTELANRGFHVARTSLSGILQTLCKKKRLRRQKGVAGDKAIYGYSNW